MNVSKLHIAVLSVALVAPSVALADNTEPGPSADAGGYYFNLDYPNLRRDIADVRYFYARPTATGSALADSEEDFLYFGAGMAGGFTGLWVPSSASPPAGPATASGWSRDVRFGVGWRPDVTSSDVAGVRQIRRTLTGGEIDRVGVRADVTALLFDDNGSETTAWRISGMLGSTSLSLVSGDAQTRVMSESDGGLLWDVGVGWSSGPMSLSAGYQSVAHVVEGDMVDMAVLSLGADYTILPGLSVFGEFNLIDDAATLGDERLGTVIIVGTGLNF